MALRLALPGEVRLEALVSVTDTRIYGPVAIYAGHAGGAPAWVRVAMSPGPLGLMVWEREVELLEDLAGQPGVVRLLDSHDWEDQAWLAVARGPGGTLDGVAPGAVVGALVGVLSALAALHAAGVVHGALHPGVVHLGRAPALDGFAAAAARSLGLRDFDVVGETRAPELAVGGAPSELSDLYAAGCLAWRLVSGEWPFCRPTPRALATAHRLAPLPGLVPRAGFEDAPGLETWLRRMLARAPCDRFGSAAAAADALRAVA